MKMKKMNRFGKIFYIEGDYNYGRVKKITKRGKIPFYSVTYGGGLVYNRFTTLDS